MLREREKEAISIMKSIRPNGIWSSHLMTLFDPSGGAGGGGGVVMAEKRGRGSVMAQAARSIM